MPVWSVNLDLVKWVEWVSGVSSLPSSFHQPPLNLSCSLLSESKSPSFKLKEMTMLNSTVSSGDRLSELFSCSVFKKLGSCYTLAKARIHPLKTHKGTLVL